MYKVKKKQNKQQDKIIFLIEKNTLEKKLYRNSLKKHTDTHKHLYIHKMSLAYAYSLIHTKTKTYTYIHIYIL